MRIAIVTGATASGKTSAALDIAKQLNNIEIISADAFQVYKGFDIGTAKASNDELSICPHHLIDILEPSDRYTAGLFCEQAERTISDILSRGKKPIIVGGTGLYIKTLTDGIFQCPPIDESIRTELYQRQQIYGLAMLYDELVSVDPEYAARISNNDPVRIIRALEVFKGLGIPFTQAHKEYHVNPQHEYSLYTLNRDRADLYADINKRTKEMWDNGWVDEVRSLLDSGVTTDVPAFRAIGYKAIYGYINKELEEQQVIDIIAKDTRRFAKRQMTWFRGVDNITAYDKKSDLISDIMSKYTKLL